jgi:cytochrome P450
MPSRIGGCGIAALLSASCAPQRLQPQGIVAKIINERRKDANDRYDDLLAMLMKSRDENGQPMADHQLRDEVLTFLLAGQETTALVLSWSLYLLGQYPNVMSNLQTEVSQVLRGRSARIQDQKQLLYTGQIISEAMRLFPPAWIVGREAAEDCKIGGYFVPKGTTIFISPWVLHRSPRFFEAPTDFRPERWAGSLGSALPRFAYMPFGGGPRICIGNRFALMEASLILATIAQKFGIEWQADKPVSPMPSITLRPQGGISVKLSANNPILHKPNIC